MPLSRIVGTGNGWRTVTARERWIQLHPVPPDDNACQNQLWRGEGVNLLLDVAAHLIDGAEAGYQGGLFLRQTDAEKPPRMVGLHAAEKGGGRIADGLRPHAVEGAARRPAPPDRGERRHARLARERIEDVA